MTNRSIPRRNHGVRRVAVVFLHVALFGLTSVAAFKPVRTKLMRGGDKPQSLSVDVTGVKDLYLVVTHGPDNYRSDQAIWGEPKLFDTQGAVVDMTTLKPKRAQVGWGRLCLNHNQHKKPLAMAGKTYKTGFWAHGPSVLHFELGGRYTKLTADVGIDKGAGTAGSVEFEVTDKAPAMPTREVFTREKKGKARAPKAPPLVAGPAHTSPHTFNPAAAKKLLARGVEELVFVRRFTLTANHVYTEYLNSRWMPGGGLTVLDLKTGKARDLVPGLTNGVVNRFDISYDASKIVFDFRRPTRRATASTRSASRARGSGNSRSPRKTRRSSSASTVPLVTTTAPTICTRATCPTATLSSFRRAASTAFFATPPTSIRQRSCIEWMAPARTCGRCRIAR